MKTTVIKLRLLSEQFKKDEPWLNLVYMYSVVLSLKQRRGAYCYRGTYRNEKAY